MRQNGISIKTIVAIGIGSAVFVILGRFAAIPTGIPNTSIATAYAFLALMAVVFGPIAGGLIGLIGHALQDATTYGSIWWSWVIVSAFVGFFIGLLASIFKNIRVEEGLFKIREIIIFNIIQVGVQIVGWMVIAPSLDVLIYSEPAKKVYAQGVFAGISNIITVGILGTILITAYAKTRHQSGSLSKE